MNIISLRRKCSSKKLNIVFSLLLLAISLTACGGDEASKEKENLSDEEVAVSSLETPKLEATEQTAAATRDSQMLCLEPESPGTEVYGNEVVSVDTSNSRLGYITVKYLGTNSKVKFQLTGSDGVTYTYNLDSELNVFPLTGGNGTYEMGCYENISGQQYAVSYTGAFEALLENEFGPYLYPNQYVNFNEGSLAVSKGEQLVKNCANDLAAAEAVYDYMVENISYDYDKAVSVESGYIPDVDETLESQSGICLDYAVLMAAMLRSQQIPTRLEVGYAGEAYHAWISTYITDVGWIDNIIYFDGESWVLMDPTFAANTEEETFAAFIGDGSNYVTLYKY